MGEPKNLECYRIADQLRRAYSGEAWHGPSLAEVLACVTAAQANMRPLPKAHSIWELVLHITVWTNEALQAITVGKPMGTFFRTPLDWPLPTDASESAWVAAKDQMFQCAKQLENAIDALDEARLFDIVPGREYDFYFLFHGVVQHSLYHAGQIAMLNTALTM